jgi:hypothetical protein
MNPLAKSISFLLVRAVMLAAGASGVELVEGDLNKLIDAVLVIAPIIWSIIEKYQHHTDLAEAKGEA